MNFLFKSKTSKDLFQLRAKYASCVSAVIFQSKKKLSELDSLGWYTYNQINEDYFQYFIKKINWVCTYKISGKPDSFIMAACMYQSIIEHPVIKLDKSLCKKGSKLDMILIEETANFEIALASALEIISEPVTWYFDNVSNQWIEEKHRSVNISIPDGIIKNSPLSKRFSQTVYYDLKSESSISIMQLSNFFHLIYLYCSK